MIKQNIKIAIVSIICFITFWLVMFNFIKIDKASQAFLYFDNTIPMVSIENETSAYIQKHEIDRIKVEFNKQYFECHITFNEYNEQYSTYLIVIPSEVYKAQTYMLTNIIVDRQNLYQHWFSK